MRVVTTTKQLKDAIAAGDEILVTDPKLAMAVRAIKGVPPLAMAALVAAAAVAAANAWNPIGWSIGAAGLVGEGALVGAVTFLVIALGVGVFWGLFNGYDIDGTVKAPGGFSAEVKLRPKKQS